MIRLIGLAVAAFLMAMGGVTGALLLHNRPSAADLPAAFAEVLGGGESSRAVADEPAGSGDLAPADPLTEAAVDSVELAGPAELAHDSAGTAETDSAASPAAIADGVAVAAAVPEAGAQATSVADTTAAPLPGPRLAKIFGSMQPREAARVLEQMDDHDVVAIMGMMNDRQAAAVLANLPPQRAAGISRLGSRTGGGER